MNDQAHIQRAIEVAHDAKLNGELPFGAVLVGPDDQVVLEERDRVNEFRDPTRHAETLLVRKACELLGPDLSDYTLYTTCEPCAMCFTSAWLTGIKRIVTGTTMQDVYARSDGLHQEMPATMQTMNNAGGNRIKLTERLMADECLALFDSVDFTPLR